MRSLQLTETPKTKVANQAGKKKVRELFFSEVAEASASQPWAKESIRNLLLFPIAGILQEINPALLRGKAFRPVATKVKGFKMGSEMVDHSVTHFKHHLVGSPQKQY